MKYMITDVCEVSEINGRVKQNKRKRTATLTFSVVGNTTTTECRLDDGPFKSCKLFWCLVKE